MNSYGIRPPVLDIAIHQPPSLVIVDPYQPQHRAPFRQIEGAGYGAPRRRGRRSTVERSPHGNIAAVTGLTMR